MKIAYIHVLSRVHLALLLRVHRGELISRPNPDPRGDRFATTGFRGIAEQNAWPGLLSRMGLVRVDATLPADQPRPWLLTPYGRRELAAAGLLDSRPGHVTSVSVPGAGSQSARRRAS